MLGGIRHLSFEIGSACNLAHEHKWCPAHNRRPVAKRMDTDHIVVAIRSALDMGFTGFVGFHYYNEPTLYKERMKAVMDAVPEARYMLWTNGIIPAPDGFDWVVQTSYDGCGNYPFAPDQRLKNYDAVVRESGSCYRPFIELQVDYAGNVKLCCQDWRGTESFGNITQEPFKDIALRWLERVETISIGEPLPDVCKSCLNPQSASTYFNALREVGM